MIRVLGYTDLGATLLVAGACARWLWVAGSAPYTWMRKVHAPKLAAGPVTLSDDLEGLV